MSTSAPYTHREAMAALLRILQASTDPSAAEDADAVVGYIVQLEEELAGVARLGRRLAELE